MSSYRSGPVTVGIYGVRWGRGRGRPTRRPAQNDSRWTLGGRQPWEPAVEAGEIGLETWKCEREAYR